MARDLRGLGICRTLAGDCVVQAAWSDGEVDGLHLRHPPRDLSHWHRRGRLDWKRRRAEIAASNAHVPRGPECDWIARRHPGGRTGTQHGPVSVAETVFRQL